jgi:hypothetical protein
MCRHCQELLNCNINVVYYREDFYLVDKFMAADALLAMGFI